VHRPYGRYMPDDFPGADAKISLNGKLVPFHLRVTAKDAWEVLDEAFIRRGSLVRSHPYSQLTSPRLIVHRVDDQDPHLVHSWSEGLRLILAAS
jgi:hypothetical protein